MPVRPWDEPVTQPDQARIQHALTALKVVPALGVPAHRSAPGYPP